MNYSVSPATLEQNPFNSRALKTYSKITFDGGEWCVCEPKDVAEMTKSEEGFKVDDILMTEAEFEALPEFNG